MLYCVKKLVRRSVSAILYALLQAAVGDCVDIEKSE